MTAHFTKPFLEEYYLAQRQSAAQIAKKNGCSESKVHYWLQKYAIPKRSIADAVYVRCNSEGDPFSIQSPSKHNEWLLLGLGVGLYWGEGTKRSKNAVRLGNTDPELIKCFIDFLKNVCKIDHKKLRFGLQIFSDMNPTVARAFWQRKLNVSADQFYKTIVTGAQSIGTYRNKTSHGVLTVYFNNTKLRNKLCDLIADVSKMY